MSESAPNTGDPNKSLFDVAADAFAEEAGSHARPLARPIFKFLRGLVVADASVTPEEHVLFNDLCERWGVEMELLQ